MRKDVSPLCKRDRKRIEESDPEGCANNQRSLRPNGDESARGDEDKEVIEG